MGKLENPNQTLTVNKPPENQTTRELEILHNQRKDFLLKKQTVLLEKLADMSDKAISVMGGIIDGSHIDGGGNHVSARLQLEAVKEVLGRVMPKTQEITVKGSMAIGYMDMTNEEMARVLVERLKFAKQEYENEPIEVEGKVIDSQ